MEIHTLLDLFPIWAIFLLTVALVVLAIELGQRLARYQVKRLNEVNEQPVGPIVGAILGLLAFMLAFTFGFAASRFEERKQILQNEVNTIGTVYLRSTLLPEPIPSDSQRLLREYVDIRIEGTTSAENLEIALERSREVHTRLWEQAILAAEKGRPPINSLFVQSVNELIDTHSKRVTAGLRNRLPGVIWLALYTLMFLAMTSIGYQGGLSSKRRPLAGIILVLAFSAVISLVVDLDRPGGGLLRVSQDSMIELRRSFDQTSSIGK